MSNNTVKHAGHEERKGAEESARRTRRKIMRRLVQKQDSYLSSLIGARPSAVIAHLEGEGLS